MDGPASKPRLLIAERRQLGDADLARLNEHFAVDCREIAPGRLGEAIGPYQGVIVHLGHRIDRDVLQRAERLAFVATPTTGLNHIDLEAAAARGVTVLSLQGENDFLETIPATAELTFGLILALVRHIPAATRHVSAGGWDRDAFVGRDLAGRTLGILGLGRIGRMVARYGLAFGMQVIASDRNGEDGPSTKAPGVELVPVPALLARSEILSIHLPSGPQTRGFLSAGRIGSLRRGALLVNTARGDLIDEAALLEALRDGRIGGAALDVLADEYDSAAAPTSAALRRMAEAGRGVILTPHIGGATIDSWARVEHFLVDKIVDAVRSGQVLK